MSQPKTNSTGGRLAVILTLLIAGNVIAAGFAWAAVTNNLVPTANYSPYCNEPGIVTNGTVCQTDNADVYYYMDSNGEYELEAEDKDVVRDMLSGQYAPTHLVIHYDSTPVFSGSGETDIIYQEGSVSGSADGTTWCNDDSPSAYYECDQQYVRIQGAGSYTPGLSCHETGHAVGLLHGNLAAPKLSNDDNALGCMQTPVSFSEPLGDNNRDNINRVY